jgi:hypothetical protein
VQAADVGPDGVADVAGEQAVMQDASDATVDGTPDDAPDGAPPDACDADGCGGVVRLVTTTATDLAVTGAALYWLDGMSSVMTSGLDGSNAHALVTGEATPLAGIEADLAYVYFTANGSLRAVPVTGGTPTTVGTLTGACLRWATVGTEMVASDGLTLILKASVFGTAPAPIPTVLTNNHQPWGVAYVGPLDLFWADAQTGFGWIRQDLNGNFSTPVNGEPAPHCMATDTVSLYWTNNGDGSIRKMPVTGTTPQSIVTGQTGASGIAIDAFYVYWTYQGGIARAPR